MSQIENTSPDVEKKSPFDVHVRSMEKRLKHWRAEMDQLAQTALSVEITKRAAFDKKVIDLRAQLELAQIKLHALRGAGEHKWESFKEALELSVRELEKAFKS